MKMMTVVWARFFLVSDSVNSAVKMVWSCGSISALSIAWTMAVSRSLTVKLAGKPLQWTDCLFRGFHLCVHGVLLEPGCADLEACHFALNCEEAVDNSCDYRRHVAIDHVLQHCHALCPCDGPVAQRRFHDPAASLRRLAVYKKWRGSPAVRLVSPCPPGIGSSSSVNPRRSV